MACFSPIRRRAPQHSRRALTHLSIMWQFCFFFLYFPLHWHAPCSLACPTPHVQRPRCPTCQLLPASCCTASLRKQRNRRVNARARPRARDMDTQQTTDHHTARGEESALSITTCEPGMCELKQGRRSSPRIGRISRVTRSATAKPAHTISAGVTKIKTNVHGKRRIARCHVLHHRL